MKGTDYMNVAVSNQIGLFEILATISKLLRIADLHHRIKVDKDAYHDDKRTAFEVKLLKEMKEIKARTNITLVKTLNTEHRIHNIEKMINAIYKATGMESLLKNLAEDPPQANFTKEEAEEKVEVEVLNEHIRLDGMDDASSVSGIQDQDELIEEVLGKKDDSGSSLNIVEEKDLNEEQRLYRERSMMVANLKKAHGFEAEVASEAFSYTGYRNLMHTIQTNHFVGTTPVGPPESMDLFKHKYGFEWTPSMIKVACFDPARAKQRVTMPEPLKLQVAKEKAEKAARRVEKLERGEDVSSEEEDPEGVDDETEPAKPKGKRAFKSQPQMGKGKGKGKGKSSGTPPQPPAASSSKSKPPRRSSKTKTPSLASIEETDESSSNEFELPKRGAKNDLKRKNSSKGDEPQSKKKRTEKK